MSFLFLTAALAALVTLTSPNVRACEVALKAFREKRES
jgi:hypothetical protein